uniref:(northern house mosquito) hypothetical protein n=1 Tax=Culex pipiens TaxID=7175 RepID=A0A8D8EBQ8_CULPI
MFFAFFLVSPFLSHVTLGVDFAANLCQFRRVSSLKLRFYCFVAIKTLQPVEFCCNPDDNCIENCSHTAHMHRFYTVERGQQHTSKSDKLFLFIHSLPTGSGIRCPAAHSCGQIPQTHRGRASCHLRKKYALFHKKRNKNATIPRKKANPAPKMLAANTRTPTKPHVDIQPLCG